MPMFAGEMIPTWVTNSAPATPAMAAESMNTPSFTIARSYPKKRSRSSLSRLLMST